MGSGSHGDLFRNLPCRAHTHAHTYAGPRDDTHAYAGSWDNAHAYAGSRDDTHAYAGPWDYTHTYAGSRDDTHAYTYTWAHSNTNAYAAGWSIAASSGAILR